ncbi:AsnC family transcriptional regulator [Defluviimonas sp. WL0075]|uniref:siroheme decarboxylase n=1 Tax=Albidovulum sediminicola TaxID=2984331 RepID=A0ABT2Z3V7_9RHOB|nr:AsnC family transcriptional regulator [Defluviimonas sp. WL0075]MCV2865818.1 AsnC family transcriptional regulator [Defluviimonas sp. WL0075]
MQGRDPIDTRLLDEFQRDLPLVERPFAAMAAALAIPEGDVIERLARLKAEGAVARVGATVRPNTAGASTLAAVSVPTARIEEVAAIVNAEPGVNHSYLREDDWNLWFVATAPDAVALEASLRRLETDTGLKVLDLRLVRAFNIDLGFRLSGARRAMAPDAGARPLALTEEDRALLANLSRGLPLVPRPFAALGLAEAEALSRIATLLHARVITRLGVIVRHRPLGWTANAMVVWDLPEPQIPAAGAALSALPGVTLCYQRRTAPDLWPFALYSMIHGRSRAEALAVLDQARALPELAGASARPLFSTRCFKQTGALIAVAA